MWSHERNYSRLHVVAQRRTRAARANGAYISLTTVRSVVNVHRSARRCAKRTTAKVAPQLHGLADQDERRRRARHQASTL